MAKCKTGQVWNQKTKSCQSKKSSRLKKNVSERRTNVDYGRGETAEITRRTGKKKGILVKGSTTATRSRGGGKLSEVAPQYTSERKRTVTGPFKKVGTSKTVKRTSTSGGRERVESQREYKLFGKTIKGKKRVKVKKRGKAKKRFHSMSKRHPDYDY